MQAGPGLFPSLPAPKEANLGTDFWVEQDLETQKLPDP